MMPQLIRIHKTAYDIPKVEYTAAARSKLLQFPEEYTSLIAKKTEDRLAIGLDDVQIPDLENSSVIIVQDIQEQPSKNDFLRSLLKFPEWYRQRCVSSYNERFQNLVYHKQPKEFYSFEPFKFKFSENKLWVIRTLKGGEEYAIGKLAKGESIRFSYNAKSDFTLTGRKNRVYHEFLYVLTYEGSISQVVFKKNCKSTISAQNFKKYIDERVRFY